MKDLEKYKDKFLENIEYQCNIYKLIGNGTTESPMWFQYRSKSFEEDNNNNKLLFVNSQKSGIYFEIEIEKEDSWIQYEAFTQLYDYFRDLKYEYIKENHPTIYKQIK